MKLQPLIKSLKLDWVNDSINDKNFPYEKTKGKVELINFKKSISTDDALKEMDERGLRPATIHETLQWAKKNWNEKDIVIALGSVWQDFGGGRNCPCLGRYGSRRYLGLYWFDYDFGELCRFGAVRLDKVNKESKLNTWNHKAQPNSTEYIEVLKNGAKVKVTTVTTITEVEE